MVHGNVFCLQIGYVYVQHGPLLPAKKPDAMSHERYLITSDTRALICNIPIPIQQVNNI